MRLAVFCPTDKTGTQGERGKPETGAPQAPPLPRPAAGRAAPIPHPGGGQPFLPRRHRPDSPFCRPAGSPRFEGFSALSHRLQERCEAING